MSAKPCQRPGRLWYHHDGQLEEGYLKNGGNISDAILLRFCVSEYRFTWE